jgi:hypothetical protein
MPWVRLTFDRFDFGRDAGPPPSFRLTWLRLSWWRGSVTELLENLERALRAAREELRR